MTVFKKLDIPFNEIKLIDMTDIFDYENCLQLVFINEHKVNLFDFNTNKFIDTIKF